MKNSFHESFKKLKNYCEEENYKGWDPYDGLTSRFFRSLPLIRNNAFFRLAWIQLFKRNPFNLRPITGVKKEYNAKGLGLFLTSYCLLYQKENNDDYLKKIVFFADELLSLQNSNYSGSCWGYYFDWQARAFFQPAHTPTVVATSFVVDALLNAYDITREKRYLDTALSSADFVLKDLNRTYDSNGNFAFSYSPLDSTQVFNASLLGARLLSRVYSYLKNEVFKIEARKAVAYACSYQKNNGSWSYGTLPFHSWIDNFHTGFNLECIFEYSKYTGDASFDENINVGFNYYVNTFFCENGASKYYNNQLYPVDIHAPAQLLVTLSKLEKLTEYQDLADKVLEWTILNMQDRKGFFYYQKKKLSSSKIPYMRWAQAWMFYAFAHYFSYNHHTRNEGTHSSAGNPSR